MNLNQRLAGFIAVSDFSVVAAVFGGLALWSVVAPIDGAVIAGGQVVVESNRKTVQHLEGGVIGAIEVSEGEFATKGQVVARLEDTVQRANAALIARSQAS